ncbi:MAG: hypothetical protein LBH03_01320 [Holophagales bacterium]|nr:hypothetical protein [Holophagales bacterium]
MRSWCVSCFIRRPVADSLASALSQNAAQEHADADHHKYPGVDDVKPEFPDRLSRKERDPKERTEKAEQRDGDPRLGCLRQPLFLDG